MQLRSLCRFVVRIFLAQKHQLLDPSVTALGRPIAVRLTAGIGVSCPLRRTHEPGINRERLERREMRLGHGAAGIWKRSPSARSSKYRLSGKRSYRRSKSSLISRFAKSSLPWQRWHAIAWCQEKGCHARMGAHCAAFTDWRRRRLCCGGGVDRPNCRRVGARDGDAGLGRRAPPISAAPPRQGRVKPEEAYRRYAAELAVSGINAWFFSSYSPSDEQIMLSPGARGSHRSIRERFRAWAEKTAEIAGFPLAQP